MAFEIADGGCAARVHIPERHEAIVFAGEDELAVFGNRGCRHVAGARVEFSDFEILGTASGLEKREDARDQEEPEEFLKLQIANVRLLIWRGGMVVSVLNLITFFGLDGFVKGEGGVELA